MAKAKNKRIQSAVHIDDPDGPGMIKAITKLAQVILQRHWDRMQGFRADSGADALTVTLKVDLEYGADSTPSYDVGIRYSQAVTDHLKGQIDPNQGTFTEIEAEADGDNDKPEKPEEEEEPKETDKD